jgi:hypothetical protein
MRIRRVLVTLVSVAALSGGIGGLTGCSDPSNSKTGTPQDTATDTSAKVPSDSSIGSTPTAASTGG